MTHSGLNGSNLDGDMVVQAAPSVTATSLGEGMALLDMKSSTYYQLNGLGAFVWNSLHDPIDLKSIVALIRRTFDVGDADVDADVAALIGDLAGSELVVLKNANVA